MTAYEEATRAYMAGQKTEAQTLLGQALRANPRDQASWLLLSQCVDAVERKKYCLQQVLLLNPKNPEALERLAELEKRPTPPFRANTVPAEEVKTTPLVNPETASPIKPVTRPLASSLGSPSGSQADAPAAPDDTTAEARKPITRPLPAIPSEQAVEEPKRPITRPLAPPPELVEVKKPATQPLPPPPPALQEILNARAQGGANDETLIGPSAKKGTGELQPVEAEEDDFAPLPDSVPAVSGIESALMDDKSFRPGPFSEAEQERPETDTFDSPAAEPDADLRPAEVESVPSSNEAAGSETDEVTLVGVSAPVAIPETPAMSAADKAALRARLEQAVSYLEKDDKLEGIKILDGILADDPRNELAWMWLGAASYDVSKQRECYLRALEVNPRNKLARQRLDAVEDKLTAAGIALVPLATPLPPAPKEEPSPASQAGLWIGIIVVMLTLFIVVGLVIVYFIRR